MGLFDAEPLVIGLSLDLAIEKRHTLLQQGVLMVALFSDSQATICRMAHLEPGAGLRLGRSINSRARNFLANGITTEMHWVPGDSGIPGNKETDCQTNLARDCNGMAARYVSRAG